MKELVITEAKDLWSLFNTLATMGLTGESQTHIAYVQWDSPVSP